MRSGESMKEFSDRFTNVVNELSSLGKKYDNKETIVKVCRSLPSAWDIKIMVMRESNSLGQMKFHDVFEDLKPYEFEMRSRIEDEASTSTATKALVTSLEPTVPVPVQTAEQFTEDAMAMLARKFGNFIKKNQPLNNYNYNYGDKSNIRCFNCNALGHYKSECRKPRRDDRRLDDQRPANNNQRGEHLQFGESKEVHKELIADDGGSLWAHTDSDNDDKGFTCLMAKEEEVFDFSCEEFTKEDLVTVLNDIVVEFKNLSSLLPTRLNVHIDKLSNFQTGGKSANRKSSNELNLNKNKLPFIIFVKSSSTDNEADHDSKLAKEIKYIKKNKRLGNSEWYLGSGCSRHMTGNSRLLTDIVQEADAMIIFGDNSKGRAVGKATPNLIKLLRRLQNEKSIRISKIRTDRGTAFTNSTLIAFLEESGIRRVV
ncbi:uncharacterized protein LOC124939063 [Impatiens glandulifera]|uniref:uncharacterized protein LOC124939063 n=1 Tax=Impatiens glandulifera TaxID=253017 RepID=UPI001FB0EE63|nr:uncharacterized protein LOC124939063 [Impatiens glandulifera]